MSVSVQQILGEARRLVGRLREQDVSADQLLAHAHALGQNVETMRQYNEELTQLTENSSVGTGLPRPRAALVLSIQQENRHIRELQQENRELVATLKEHQSALELIMAKYREQVTRLGSTCQVEEKLGLGASLSSAMAALPQCHHLADKVCEMAAVMRRAAEVDEERDSKHTELLVQLRAENGILRRLLDIGRKVGSAGLTDEESQTENVGLGGDASSTAPEVAQ